MKASSVYLIAIVCTVELIFVQTRVTNPMKIVEEYNVTVTNSGPVFYHSLLTFNAALYLGTSAVPKDAKSYRYEWESSTDHLTESQDADLNTSLTRCYSFAPPGTYNMNLKVFNVKLLKKDLVAKTKQKFTLTEHVNGRLTGHQKGINTTELMIFSTKKPIEVKLDLSDRFISDPSFTYLWYLGSENETVANVTDPTHQFSINETGVHIVKVKVHSRDSVADCDGFPDIKPSGEFQADLVLYDPIGAVQVVGKSTVKNTSYVTQNIYFNGSSPLSINWTFANASDGEVISSGHRNLVKSSPVTVELKKNLVIGQYYFTVTVQNPVSRQDRRHNFTVTYHEPPTHSAAVIVLPLVGGVAVMTLIVLVVVNLIVPRWKGRHVETADFDFHPSLRLQSNTEEPGFFTSVKFRLKRYFGRVDKSENQNTGAKRLSNYGSLDSYSVRT